MKVALELQPCCGNRSGIGTYTYELAKRLQDTKDLQFQGNLFNFMGRNDNSAALCGIEMPMNESRLFPYGVYRRLWSVLPIPYSSLFPQKSDLSLFFNYIVPPHIHGKVITTIHDLTYLRFPETMEQKNLKRIQHGIDRSIKRCDKIITVSEFSKREIMELLNIPSDKISVVPNAASFSEETVEFASLEEKYGIKVPYILYVGTIEPRKNILRLIHAYEYLKAEKNIPHHLVLAGGNGWKTDDIYRGVQESSWKEEIHFTGFVSSAEKNTLYKNASVFAFPSLYEGFGIPPLEAMHWGCPTVVADAASLPEVVGDAAALVDAYSVEGIADGIWMILSDESYASELVGKGKKQTERYTWEASAERLIEICKEVLCE